MKKVFLSLAVIAALTVVSCKQAEEAPAEEVVTEEVAPVAEEVVADSTTVVADSTATAAPAAEEKK
ncbi:hypothetical protein [Flavobacterium sp.]|jgi:uncharacterized protein YcfL|uniref:hypothetical protein n=1 Tax=Flavobacterium sp. TaxID=239 RepID=UPI0037BE7548